MYFVNWVSDLTPLPLRRVNTFTIVNDIFVLTTYYSCVKAKLVLYGRRLIYFLNRATSVIYSLTSD